MGREFGIGKIDPVTGVVFAPPLAADDLAYFGPMLVVDESQGEVRLALAGSGGMAAPAAMGIAAAALLSPSAPVARMLDEPRIFAPGQPGMTLVEPGFDAAAARSLFERGHDVKEASRLGIVNAIDCPGGLISAPDLCSFLVDRRGFGLALGGS
jgi:gamma-glutamyltranspeptidase